MLFGNLIATLEKFNVIHSFNIKQHLYCKFSSERPSIYSETIWHQDYINRLSQGISFSPHNHSLIRMVASAFALATVSSYCITVLDHHRD